MCDYKIPQSKQVLYWISVHFYRKHSDKFPKDVFEDAIKHKNPNHKCSYFGSECPYKGIEFLEKIELKDM